MVANPWSRTIIPSRNQNTSVSSISSRDIAPTAHGHDLGHHDNGVAEVDELLRLPPGLRKHLLRLTEELLRLSRPSIHPRVRQLGALVQLEVGREVRPARCDLLRIDGFGLGPTEGDLVDPPHDLDVLLRHRLLPQSGVLDLLPRLMPLSEDARDPDNADRASCLGSHTEIVIEPGQPAPDFELPDQDGNSVRLSGLRGQPVVLYFYPRADTPGCTTQACGVRDHRADYEAAGARVLGVSPDSVEDVRRFADKHELGFTLLADADHGIADLYGTWGEKSMYGKKYMGVTPLDLHHRRRW